MGLNKKGVYVSVRRNAELAPDYFEYNKDTGLFGEKGNHPETRIVKSANPLESAEELFAIMGEGGENIPVKNNPGVQRILLPGRAWITMRVTTKSGSPAVEINVKSITYPTKVKSQKIHFIEEGD